MRTTALREVSCGRRGDSGSGWCLGGQETEPLQIVYIIYIVVESKDPVYTAIIIQKKEGESLWLQL